MNYILDVLKNKNEFKTPPIWLMRQAGRYLPEYMKVREDVRGFLDLCYNPELACKVTLQPIDRFDFDAAIIFSDILVIPHALGSEVEFIKGYGPKLSKTSSVDDVRAFKLDRMESFLKPVFEAVSLTRSKLDKNKSLIGFAGCPWTLACYMIEGGGSKNFNLVRQKALEDEEFFGQLIDVLTNAVIEYLSLKIEAGADIIKIFDSWAGILPPPQLKKWVFKPAKKIVSELKNRHPDVPVICFPKGIALSYVEFLKYVDCDSMAIDRNLEGSWVRDNLVGKGKLLQGNFDNFVLAFGSKDDIKREVEAVFSIFGDKPFIFNLGHGVLPQTPVENVKFLVDLVRSR